MPNPATGAILGPYQVEGFLGAGSMGDVFRGVDSSLGRKVAIKLLADKHRDSAELRARFTREGRAVAMVSHPNVVQVFTTGTFDARPYIAMEFLDGVDLGTMIDDGGPMSSLDAARATRDAAAGLHAAANAGLIHRDVKPSNLVKLTTGGVKVTDFGLAKAVDPGSEPALTALGVVVGTPDYIAPEQARGETIDDRVDIYALGGTLFFLLTSKPPFRTGIAAEDKYLKVVARHLRQAPPDARDKVPSVDGALADLARAMMAKKPSDRPRYPELLETLDDIIGRLSGVSGRVARVTGNPTSTSDSGKRGRLRTPSRGNPAPAARASGATSASNGDAHRTVAHPARRVFDSGATMGDTSADMPTPVHVLTRPLLVLTIIASLALVVGAIVYLTRSSKPAAQPAVGSGRASLGSGSGSAGSGSGSSVVSVTPVVPVAPAGMTLVRKLDDTPWFFVDVRPVNGGEFVAMFGTHKLAKGGQPKPVVGTTYVGARGYAKTQGSRLMTSAEFDAAMRTVGVQATPAGLSEWIDSDTGKTVRTAGKTATRSESAPNDVTFRRARDL